MHSLVEYDVIYLDTIRGKDIRYGIITFKNPKHFWNSTVHEWGTRIEEHRFNPLVLSELSSIFDRIEAEITTLAGSVITGEGKYFCNGIDVSYIQKHPENANSVQKGVEKLMARILSLGLVTVALINGHAAGAGAIISLCCDYRVMNDRGLFVLPAVELGIVYSQGFIEVVKSKVHDERLRRDMLLLSKKYTSVDLQRCGLVDIVVSEQSSLDESLRIIHENFQKNHHSYSLVKQRLYKKAISCLMDERVSDMHWSRI